MPPKYNLVGVHMYAYEYRLHTPGPRRHLLTVQIKREHFILHHPVELQKTVHRHTKRSFSKKQHGKGT